MELNVKLNANEDTGSLGFTGVHQLQIVGVGSIKVLKSVDRGETFFPLTDDSGEEVNYSSGEVLYNSEIKNDCSAVRFKFLCTEGEVEVKLVK